MRLGVLVLLPCAAQLACAVCEPPAESALDYDADAAWACRPGADNDPCSGELTFAEEGESGVTVGSFTPAVDPAAACFWVYPTVDLSLVAGVHDDLSDPSLQRNAVVNQTAALTEVCDVHAPLYRQVTLGVYAHRNREERDRCFEIASSDVKRAFTAFLERIGDRPFIIGGHSQGAQMTTLVVREVIEPDPALRARMIAAAPIGWPVGVAAGSDRGGTFAETPVCEERGELGCALSFRSFAVQNRMPRDPRGVNDLFVGDETVCTNPVAEGAPLTRSLFATDSPLARMPAAIRDSGARFGLFRSAFTARCVDDAGNTALAIESVDGVAPPVDLSRNLYASDSGTHLLDMQFTQGDLADLLAHKIAIATGR